MRIIDNRLLAEFRSAGPCEVCAKWCRKREAHHIHTRGAGRLDVRINLIALGSTEQRQCACHRNAARIGRAAFLEIVARREQTTVDAIIEEIYRLRRLPQPRVELVRRKRKGKKPKTAWQIRAGELRRARGRAIYRWIKEKRKANA